jgi:hypothetical protein
LKKVRLFKELPRHDLAEDELITHRDRRAWPRAGIFHQAQECEALATVVAIAVTVLEPFTVVPSV